MEADKGGFTRKGGVHWDEKFDQCCKRKRRTSKWENTFWIRRYTLLNGETLITILAAVLY